MDICDVYKPKFSLVDLRKQVQEQSSVCDFTIKVGTWSRRFHSSVLINSPFFKRLIDGYLSRKQARIELNGYTATTVETAVTFLYGLTPNVCEKRLTELFDLAEFLMIPNLKALCVKHAENIPVNIDNLKNLLELSSLYEFENRSVSQYVKSYLNEILQSDVLISATNEFIEELFTNETLRYVSMDTRLQFLIRRSQVCGTARTSIQTLLRLINLNEISASTLLLAMEAFVIDDLKQISPEVQKKTYPLTPRDCIVIFKSHSSEPYKLFDISNDQWFNASFSLDLDKASDVKYIFFFSSQPHKYGVCLLSKIQIVNLSECSSRFIEFPNDGHGSFSHICANETTVFVCKSNIINKQSKKDLPEWERELLKQWALFWTDTPYDEDLKFEVYVGTYHDYSMNIHIESKFSLKSNRGLKMYINESNICIFITHENIILYNAITYELDTIDIKASFNDNVVPLKDGFVIHGVKRAICIQRVFGPNLKCRFRIRTFDLPGSNLGDMINPCSIFHYRLVGDLWLRHRVTNSEDIFEKATERYSLHWIADLGLMKWERMTAVDEDLLRKLFSYEQNVLLMTIPSENLRCHIYCPHCKALEM
ncbi:hypothetical protein DPMN_105266 [Dreissena polymorpha]|uniref:BTB domain-containing protein n=1 Tax=Dreissena polymorpha TaxID=45954 RepID=A0A9D4HGK8_DREPO|nr:hypothetical protein DPMN_105266 [Dreissena polymorpha]